MCVGPAMDESPASDRWRFSDLWRRRDEPAERAVAQTLSRVDVDQHVPGRGTLLTEPLIVAHGEHRDDFDLFAADARPLGAAIHGNERDYELRDMSDHLVWRLQRRSRASGSGLKWRYELAWSDEPPITLKRSSRVTNTAEATQADRRIATIRPRVASSRWQALGVGIGSRLPARSPTVAVADDSNREQAWIYLARRQWFGPVALVAEMDDTASAQLRRIALAAVLITVEELIGGWGGGGG